ncbi:MAG TPA: NAD(+) diphosphatase [Acidimicrobiales bacterium]|nr:NAD(+) diphosphatase [Acidimicrobiales bacterium]
MLVPSLAPTGPSAGSALWFFVGDGGVAVEEIPADEPAPPEALFVGTVSGRHAWALEGPGGQMKNLMVLHGEVDEPTWLAAGRAVQLIDWDRSHRYCGRCATPTELAEGERSRRCPKCGLAAFPRLAPAIITLVLRPDGRGLLARNARWPTPMYSTVAGFVEPGETIEAAVRREVAEEVGIQVGAVRYFGSQPWPFPHSLMLGFHAMYESGDITVDGEEISEADWYPADDLPPIPGPISIARRLIDAWVDGTVGPF